MSGSMFKSIVGQSSSGALKTLHAKDGRSCETGHHYSVTVASGLTASLAVCCAVRTLEQPSAKRGIKVELNKTRPTGPKEAGVVTAPALTHTTQPTPHYYHHHHHHTATDCSADKGRTDTTHYNNTGALQTTQPSTYRILRAQASCRGGPGPHVFSFKTYSLLSISMFEKVADRFMTVHCPGALTSST